MNIINRSEIVGYTKSKSAVVESLVRSNALNCTGNINYNINGVKDSVGFMEVSEKFVDNFLLRVLIPDYNTKDGKNIYIGALNKAIRDLLDAHDLKKCIVKAVAFIKLKDVPPRYILDRMPFPNPNEKVQTYFYQEFKIACPNLPFDTVLNFIRNADYNNIGMFLKDIDITIDYAGSFDKYEVINHLTSTKGFREQDQNEDAKRTIVNNDCTVGRNCLTYMETVEGFTTRQKIYNKMVQMLEVKSVRSTIGCHWKDWVCQADTRLADTRDKTTHRGLTRAEVTFYIDTKIPSDLFIDKVMRSIVNYIPKSLVYSTSFPSTWKAYCDTFLHSLVCIDRYHDVGIIVYSYNEVTRNISGQYYEKWSEKEKWCLEKLSLNGNLPLDVIDVNVISKTFTMINKKVKKDVMLEISASRYYKVNPDSSTKFTTRLVSKGGIYSYKSGSVEDNVKLLEKAGFLEHENCIPYLAKSLGSTTHKADAELRKVDNFDFRITPRTKKPTKNHLEDTKEELYDEAKRIEKTREPLFQELKHKENVTKRVKEYKTMFQSYGTVPLRNLEQGQYTVKVAKKQLTQFGPSYKLLVEDGDDTYIVWSNSWIASTFEQILSDKLLQIDGDYLSLNNKPIGVLTITGKAMNKYNHITVYCSFKLNSDDEMANIPTEIDSSTDTDQEVDTTLPLIKREELLPYRDYENLSMLHIGSLHKLESMGHIEHYGIERLVLNIGGKFYQAGQDLEEKVDRLKKECSIKIEKIRTNRKRHIRYAICNIFEKGDWTAKVDYAKTPMLSIQDGSTCVVDVRSVDIKGTKRKLLLTDNGTVYKLKKSKLEEIIKPGFV